jgi:hypothetical protein
VAEGTSETGTAEEVRAALGDEGRPLEQRLADGVAGAAARLREIETPAGHRRPFTFSAGLVRDGARRRFHTTHRSLTAE